MKHVGIEIKFYNLDTFKKQIDVNFIDLDSELVDLNYKVASLIFCHFWRSIVYRKFEKPELRVGIMECGIGKPEQTLAQPFLVGESVNRLSLDNICLKE